MNEFEKGILRLGMSLTKLQQVTIEGLDLELEKMTEERDDLLVLYNNLIGQRDKAQETYIHMQRQRDQWQSGYEYKMQETLELEEQKDEAVVRLLYHRDRAEKKDEIVTRLAHRVAALRVACRRASSILGYTHPGTSEREAYLVLNEAIQKDDDRTHPKKGTAGGG